MRRACPAVEIHLDHPDVDTLLETLRDALAAANVLVARMEPGLQPLHHRHAQLWLRRLIRLSRCVRQQVTAQLYGEDHPMPDALT